MTTIDFEEDAGSTEKIDIQTLSSLGHEQLKVQRELEELQLQVSKKEEELNIIRKNRIPRIMESLRIGSFTLDSGEGIAIKRSYYGSIKDNEEQAFDWLKKNGMDDIVKNIVTIEFQRGEEEKAEELYLNLQKMGYNVDRKQSIHSSTLKAFVKERIQGKESLEEAWVDMGNVQCKEGDKDWGKYVKFAEERNQLHDLTFPEEIFKVYIVDMAEIKLQKKSTRK